MNGSPGPAGEYVDCLILFFLGRSIDPLHINFSNRDVFQECVPLQYFSVWKEYVAVWVRIEALVDVPHSRVENPLLSSWLDAALQPSDLQTQTFS